MPTSDGIDVLVAHDVLDHGVDVRAALVGKGALPDKGLVAVRVLVGQFADVAAEFQQLAQVFVARALEAHLELEVRYDANQVGVATALTVAVDGALHLRAAVAHGLQRVGDAGLAVVVGVNAEIDVGELTTLTVYERPSTWAITSSTASPTCQGRLPPLVSQSTMLPAPPRMAALRVDRAYSGLAR